VAVATVPCWPDVLARLADMGLDPVDDTPERFAARIARETTAMRALIRAASVRADRRGGRRTRLRQVRVKSL
jgi:tripartite-type tricarboxylate transporter receptor subunit TctC